MTKPPLKKKAGNNKVVQTRLKQLRILMKLDQREAAELTGISYGHWRKLERGERIMSETQMRRIARALNVAPSELLEGPPTVPIVGVAEGPDMPVTLAATDERAPVSPGSNETTVAIELRGVGHAGGWLYYFDDTKPAMSETVVGEYCVVGLGNGSVVIAAPHRAATPGLYHLESMSGVTTSDVAIAWAAFIKWGVPKAMAVRMLAHGAPSHDQALGVVVKPSLKKDKS